MSGSRDRGTAEPPGDGGPPIRVLVVEDSPSVRSLVSVTLSGEGLAVEAVGDAGAALAAAARTPPEVVVLDLGLPDMDGLRLLGILRQTHDPGVIVLTGRTDEADRILGLDLGADDYVVKPFLPGELAARVRAVWRRRQGPGHGPELRFPGLEIDLDGRRVVVRGDPVVLRRREFDLLVRLASAPGRVVSRADLLRDVWGSTEATTERTVTEHVRRVRNRIEIDPAAPRWIVSLRGTGYQFDPDGGGSDAEGAPGRR